MRTCQGCIELRRELASAQDEIAEWAKVNAKLIVEPLGRIRPEALAIALSSAPPIRHEFARGISESKEDYLRRLKESPDHEATAYLEWLRRAAQWLSAAIEPSPPEFEP